MAEPRVVTITQLTTSNGHRLPMFKDGEFSSEPMFLNIWRVKVVCSCGWGFEREGTGLMRIDCLCGRGWVVHIDGSLVEFRPIGGA